MRFQCTLLREMDGIASATLDDLGIPNPRHLYQTDDKEAWRVLSKDWELFQRHVAHILAPKVPSEQHRILAELFHDGHVLYIVSLN